MISGKLVLITGGSSGIGKHLAGKLLKSGNRVVIASNNLYNLEVVVTELKNISPIFFRIMLM